jgi:hypothetical protein
MMPAPRDLWVLFLITADEPLNGELDLMSADWRPLGECLAREPATRRTAALKWALVREPDRDAIIKGIAAFKRGDPRPMAYPPS